MKPSQPIHLSKLNQPIRKLQYATSLTPTIDRSTTPLALPSENSFLCNLLLRCINVDPHFSFNYFFTPLFTRDRSNSLCFSSDINSFESGDLSSFYHWTKYLPPVLHRYTDVAEKLTRLDPVTSSATKGTYP